MPIFRQIAEHVRRGLSSGLYRTGEAIPSLRAMALELVVNPNTVQRAYELLEREGLIEARKGLGMFVTVKGAAVAMKMAEAAVDAAFVQGIRAGRSASLPDERIRASFERAWADGRADGRSAT